MCPYRCLSASHPHTATPIDRRAVTARRGERAGGLKRTVVDNDKDKEDDGGSLKEEENVSDGPPPRVYTRHVE